MIDTVKDVLTASDISNILGITLNTIHSRRWQLSSGCPLIKRCGKLYAIKSEFEEWFRAGNIN